MYGGEAVIFEDEKYDNGGKGLKCIGFTDIESIQLAHLVGDTIWAVVPLYSSDVSTKRFSALLRAMHESNKAIIARYTYRDGNAPKLMALFPSENAMLMHELFFRDNHVELRFPLLQSKSNTPSAEQYECMDKFIDSMDLMTENKMNIEHEPGMQSSSGMFKRLLDPGLQYAYRVIAHRAINPSEPLLKIDQEILALITPPKKADAEALKAHFPLKAAKLSAKEAFMQNMLKIEKEEPESNRPYLEQEMFNDIHEIGTIKPAEDFYKLLDRGEPFNVLAKQIEDVIINLVVKSIVAMDEKVLKALIAYRETAKQKAPFKYNEWIPKIKDELKQREKVQLWQSIVNEKLGPITGNESEMSTVTDKEANEFYTIDNFNTEQIQTNNHDVLESHADLFDEM